MKYRRNTSVQAINSIPLYISQTSGAFPPRTIHFVNSQSLFGAQRRQEVGVPVGLPSPQPVSQNPRKSSPVGFLLIYVFRFRFRSSSLSARIFIFYFFNQSFWLASQGLERVFDCGFLCGICVLCCIVLYGSASNFALLLVIAD